MDFFLLESNCLIFTSTDAGSNIKEAFNLLLNDIPGQPARWCRWRGLSEFCQRKTSTRSAPRWWWWSRRQMAARITSDWPSCQSSPPSSHQSARPTLLPPSLWTETQNRSSAINVNELFELYVAFDQFYYFKRTIKQGLTISVELTSGLYFLFCISAYFEKGQSSGACSI